MMSYLRSSIDRSIENINGTVSMKLSAIDSDVKLANIYPVIIRYVILLKLGPRPVNSIKTKCKDSWLTITANTEFQ